MDGVKNENICKKHGTEMEDSGSYWYCSECGVYYGKYSPAVAAYYDKSYPGRYTGD